MPAKYVGAASESKIRTGVIASDPGTHRTWWGIEDTYIYIRPVEQQ